MHHRLIMNYAVDDEMGNGLYLVGPITPARARVFRSAPFFLRVLRVRFGVIGGRVAAVCLEQNCSFPPVDVQLPPGMHEAGIAQIAHISAD